MNTRFVSHQFVGNVGSYELYLDDLICIRE